MAESSAVPLCIFVYGSLKRGYRNHQAFCSGYEDLRPATVQGTLFRQADGYPMLKVPETAVLALGSADLTADFQRFEQVKQAWLKTQGSSADQARESLPISDLSEQGESIQGEILTWPAAEGAENQQRLSRLDRLEDFSPGHPACLYHRAIILAQHAGGWEPVWVYIAPDGILPPGVSPLGRSWP